MSVRQITVLVPAFNEAARIGRTVERLLAGLPALVDEFEVLVVDDGSGDGTADVVTAVADERVRLVRRERQGGKGAAVRSGMEAAAQPWVLMVDADLSIPITELETLRAHAADAPVVIGSKRVPGHRPDYPLPRRLFGGLGQALIGVFVVSGFHDTQCGFKLYRTDVARELFRHQRIDGFGFDFEVLFLAKRFGHRVVEVPIRMEHKAGSTVSLSSYLDTLGEVLSIAWGRLRGAYPKRPDPIDQGSV